MIAVQTSRLVLRQWCSEDRPLFAAMNADLKVMEYFPNVLSFEQSNQLVDRFSRDIDANGWGFWAAERLDSAEFIGFIGINYTPDGLPFSPCVDIGWRLASEHWGNGFATEGAIGAMSYAFNEAGLEELVSMTPITNLASERVMQKLGMTKHQENFLHPKVNQGDPLQEHVLYSLNRQQWALECAKKND